MKFKSINEGMNPWTIEYFILSTENIMKSKSHAVFLFLTLEYIKYKYINMHPLKHKLTPSMLFHQRRELYSHKIQNIPTKMCYLLFTVKKTLPCIKFVFVT